MSKRRGRGDGSVYQVDGRWVGVADLGWVGGRRKRKYVYGSDAVDVRQKLRKVQQQIDSGLPLADDRQTVGQFATWWVETALPGAVSEGTLETYSRLLRLYVTPILGRKRLKNLAPRDVTEMMRAMSAKGLSPATVNGARKVLGRVLKRAMQEELVSRNVAYIVDSAKSRQVMRRSMTTAQCKDLLSALAVDRLGVAYVLELCLGLRRGEVVGLAWTDVHLDGSPARIQVSQQLQRRAGCGLVLCALKTAKSKRTLDVPAPLIEQLKVHRVSQASEQLAIGPEWGNVNGLVFTTPRGRPVDPDNYRHRLSRITEEAGLGRWRTHELRYTAGTLLFAQGVPMKVISETLGHSSERVTSDMYVQVADEHRAQAAAAMAEVLWGTS